MTGKYPNYTLYETKDKKAMAVAAIEPKFWKRFCEVLEKPEFEKWIPLSDTPGFPTPALAKRSTRELQQMKRKIQAVFQRKTQRAWTKIFQHEPDCCCTPVLGFGDAMAFLSSQNQSPLFYLKDRHGRSIPQWSFPWGNQRLARRSHQPPPPLDSE